MNVSRPWIGGIAILAVLVIASPAWGQGRSRGGGFPGGGGGFPSGGGGFPGGGGGFSGRGGGDYQGGSRGGGDNQGGSRGGFDPRDIVQRLDVNGNGVIEPSEMNGRGGDYVRRTAERAGLSLDQPIAIEQLVTTMEAARRERDQQRDQGGGGSRDNRDNRDSRDSRSTNSSSSTSSSSASRSPAPPTGPQGFGSATETSKVPGFDVPLVAGASTEPIEKRFDERVIEYVKENMLKERDVNKNGMLERNEWTGRWSTPPEESDLNKDGILSFEELCIRIAKRFNLDGPPRGGSSNSSPGSGSFGGAPPGSFGPPGSSGGDAARIRTYAESLIRQYDENKNGMLERDEWKNMRADQQASDANRDGVITVDELAAHLLAYTSGGSRGSGRGPRGFGGDKLVVQKSYRAGTPLERLPKGMPDWFLRNDLDSDGQISMAEYAEKFTDEIAAEFMKLDTNGDGMITPNELVPAESGRRER